MEESVRYEFNRFYWTILFFTITIFGFLMFLAPLILIEFAVAKNWNDWGMSNRWFYLVYILSFGLLVAIIYLWIKSDDCITEIPLLNETQKEEVKKYVEADNESTNVMVNSVYTEEDFNDDLAYEDIYTVYEPYDDVEEDNYFEEE